VAVQVLAVALVVDEVMGRGEGRVNGKTVHASSGINDNVAVKYSMVIQA
jgi:hypothetical protein